LASVSIKTKRNFRRTIHNLKLSERALRGSEAQSGHLPGSIPRNRWAALKEQATVHGVLVLRIPARAWMAVTRGHTAARLRRLVKRDGTRISISGAWSRARVRPTHNCRRAHASAVSAAQDVACVAKKSGKSMRPKKTILCVDNNEQTLSVRQFMLETRGYRVVSALSGESALEIFRTGGIDLVLSDLLLPDVDGNELVRRMKDFSPEVPTILFSATVKAFERANRADAFLPKGA